MASSIVPSEPVLDPVHGTGGPPVPLTFTRSLKFRDDDGGRSAEPFESERLPVTLFPEIQRFLRIANSIQFHEPRVAYICRFHALEVAHNMDRNSIGRGVRQFKTSLQMRLEQDEEITLVKRREMSDMRELKRVYHTYKDYIIQNSGAVDLENRERLINAIRIASVLFEVLNTLTNAAGLETIADWNFYVPFNILPLDPGGVHHAIMQFPEIKAAIAALRNIRGLPCSEDLQKDTGFADQFDFPLSFFGFQQGNVAIQREHLILLLTNVHVKQNHKQASFMKSGDTAVDKLVSKLFESYTRWRKFLGRAISGCLK